MCCTQIPNSLSFSAYNVDLQLPNLFQKPIVCIHPCGSSLVAFVMRCLVKWCSCSSDVMAHWFKLQQTFCCKFEIHFDDGCFRQLVSKADVVTGANVLLLGFSVNCYLCGQQCCLSKKKMFTTVCVNVCGIYTWTSLSAFFFSLSFLSNLLMFFVWLLAIFLLPPVSFLIVLQILVWLTEINA